MTKRIQRLRPIAKTAIRLGHLTDDGDAHDAAAPIEVDAGRGFSVGVPAEDRDLHVTIVVEQAVCLGQE